MWAAAGDLPGDFVSGRVDLGCLWEDSGGENTILTSVEDFEGLKNDKQEHKALYSSPLRNNETHRGLRKISICNVSNNEIEKKNLIKQCLDKVIVLNTIVDSRDHVTKGGSLEHWYFSIMYKIA